MMVGALAAVSLAPAAASWRGPLLVASVGSAVLGFADDLRGLPALRRLVAQVVVAAAALPLILQDLAGPAPWRLLFGAGVLVWLVSYINAFNFMDGIDGISVAQATIAGGAWWIIGHVEEVPALVWGGGVIVGAAIGFAPFNFPRAKVFLGDVGSYFVGAWLAVLVVLGLRAGVPVEAMVAPVAVSLADTAATLIRRLRRGEALYESHCEHVYQRLVRSGRSQPFTTLLVGAVAAVCSVLGAVTLVSSSFTTRLVADLSIAGLLVGYVLSPRLIVSGWRLGEQPLSRSDHLKGSKRPEGS